MHIAHIPTAICDTTAHRDADDETHSHSTTRGGREGSGGKWGVMRGNYNRTNPGHIKRLAEDLFYFTLFRAAFFCTRLAGEFFDKMMGTIRPNKKIDFIP